MNKLFNKTRQMLKPMLGITVSAAMLVMLLGTPAQSAQTDVADHHPNDGRLSSSFQLLKGNNGSVQLETTLVANPPILPQNASLDYPSTGIDNLDSVSASYKPTFYRTLGFKLDRISTLWITKAGKLTIGNDWSNFQDILSVNGRASVRVGDEHRTVTSQIKWLSANGFSVSMEHSPGTLLPSATNTNLNSTQKSLSPSLILSWQGGPGGVVGEYRVTAMSRKLDSSVRGQRFDGKDILARWGLNIEGGWQIDDLFATLAVTFGKGIDSYILQRYENNLVVTSNRDESGATQSDTAFSIRPSLYYSLNYNSNFHVSLGHHISKDSFNHSGVDTIDTVSVGYSWSPWPSTKLDFKLTGQSAERQDGNKDFTQININAEKRF